jgi:hypothetical protein
VLGNVSVTAGGRLTTTGTTQINGSVEGFGAGNLTLTSGTVMGDVSVLNSQNITVGTAANIGALNSTNSGTLTLRGTISKVTATDSMAVNITGATIATGVIIDAGNANLTICGGATVSGGIVDEQHGRLAPGRRDHRLRGQHDQRRGDRLEGHRRGAHDRDDHGRRRRAGHRAGRQRDPE